MESREAASCLSADAVRSTEIPARQDLPIQLNGQRNYRGVGIRVECKIECAVRIKPGNVVAGNAEHAGERTPDQDLAIGLERDAINDIAGDEKHVEIQRLVEPAVD